VEKTFCALADGAGAEVPGTVASTKVFGQRSKTADDTIQEVISKPAEGLTNCPERDSICLEVTDLPD
ncbi:MAG: hypothetical protein ACOYNR_09100, partial [Blastocatellia bacterium]